MRKKHIKLMSTVVILTSLVLTLDYFRRHYNREISHKSTLFIVSLAIRQYAGEHNIPPPNLDFISDILLPEKIRNEIIYTLPQSHLYSVDVPTYDYSEDNLWFYFPDGKKAWVCIDGHMPARKIPIRNIKVSVKYAPLQGGASSQRD